MSNTFLRIHQWQPALHFKTLVFAICFGCVLTSYSQPSKAGEYPTRLSEWLSDRKINADDYPLGLIWQVPGEKAEQAKIRSDLLLSINESKGTPEAISRLIDWISSLPITGRVPISIVDPDWLRANPKHDPVVMASHQLILPKRPHTVTLVTSKGRRCQLPQVSGGKAKDYLAACDSNAPGKIDWAWLVQPDGKVKRFGIASWNLQKQDELAPGAWLWMPYREDKWTEAVSAKMAAFLATQGVSPEANQNAEGKYSSQLVISAKPEIDSNTTEFVPLVTANDWGGAGLLQSPSARMRTAGHGSMTYSRSDPYSRFNVFLQPFSWMELGFRYSIVGNRLYGPASFSGNQSYVDKSMDVKFSLLDESAYLPQVAVGTRDMTGTGLFSGEYIVANKRTGVFDWSLGMGWGYVGGRGNLSNPFSVLSPQFSTRTIDVGQGGTFGVTSYFHGTAAMFGGVQYQSPWEPLILKLEYDGNNYQNEPQSNNQTQNSPWNVGAVYRVGNAINVSLGLERGNTLLLGFTMETDLQKLSTPKLDDPAPIPVTVIRPQRSEISDSTVIDLKAQTGWSVRSIEQQGHDLRINVDGAEAVYWREYMNRANAVLNRDAATDVDYFTYVHRQHDIDLTEHRVDRTAWVQQLTQPLPPSEQSEAVTKQKIGAVQPKGSASESLYRRKPDMFEAEPGLNLINIIGGPNGYVLYQLSAEGRAKLHFREDTWLQGRVDISLLNNFSTYVDDGSSSLPRVRTHVRNYLTSSLVTMPNLQLIHAGKLMENQYYSAYAGYLEMMYAGFGAEWLYRSLDSPIAFGIDVNRVQQRDFYQDAKLREYQVGTGHATLYWDTGWNDVSANISAGRYLAGDTGVTVVMSRVFQNGISFGGYFTKTNVSAEQFGEGSFDKGLYVIIPFDAMLTKSGSKSGLLAWHPLVRDGGAKLQREVPLYDMTNVLDKRTLEYKSVDPENYIPVPSQR